MGLRVVAEMIVRRTHGDAATDAPVVGTPLPQHSPRGMAPDPMVGPAGEQSAHLVADDDEQTLCGVGVSALFDLGDAWAEVPVFHQCSRCAAISESRCRR